MVSTMGDAKVVSKDNLIEWCRFRI